MNLVDACALPLGGSGAKAKRNKAAGLVAGGMSVSEAAKEAGLGGANVALFKAEQKQGDQKGKGGLSDRQGLSLIQELSGARDSLRSDTQIGGNIDRLEILGRIISQGNPRKALGKGGELSLDVLNQVAAPGNNQRFNRAIDWAVSRVYRDLSATQKNKLAAQRGAQLLERDYSGSPGLKAVQTDLRARRDRIKSARRLF